MASRSTGRSTLRDDIAGLSVKPSVPDWACGSEGMWCRGGTEPVCVPEAGRPNVPTRRTYVLESSRSMCDLYSNTSDQVAIRDPFPGRRTQQARVPTPSYERFNPNGIANETVREGYRRCRTALPSLRRDRVSNSQTASTARSPGIPDALQEMRRQGTDREGEDS
jgi:hypothetical protein